MALIPVVEFVFYFTNFMASHILASQVSSHGPPSPRPVSGHRCEFQVKTQHGFTKSHGCCGLSAVISANVGGCSPATTLADHNKYFIIIALCAVTTWSRFATRRVGK